IDDEKIQELSNTSYQALKSQLNIRNDFCIHFEDEKGNLIFINQTHNVSGIGSPKAAVGNFSCN
ncbi:hypothetical protein HYY72_05500, partial [Candidatus Woesearchaeota archaeon]|nr:hypothetical protein [Candidatus Woesearchaeota archaeon]